MNKYVANLLAISTLCISTFAFAAQTPQYVIVVDAGSSGSRLHLFQYEQGNNLPIIKDIFSENTKPGLSSFAKNPEAAPASLKKLLDDAANELEKNHIDSHTVSISILATAGMRLLPAETQQAIYKNIGNYINQNYPFNIRTIETIPGKMEGLYGWLDINYLSQNFQTGADTLGSIDMGGASTQIAFATNDTSKPEDEISLKIGDKTYHVFSKSFLGLGQDQALAEMNNNPAAKSCYPINYPISNSDLGSFDMTACGSVYSTVINNHIASHDILPLAGQSFIAYSGAYYTYNFFGVDATPDAITLEKQITSVCNNTWDQLQKNYPEQPAKFLANYCANGVYLDNLFYGTYQIQSPQLKVASKINQQDIDWTLGAALYQIVSNNNHS